MNTVLEKNIQLSMDIKNVKPMHKCWNEKQQE